MEAGDQDNGEKAWPPQLIKQRGKRPIEAEVSLPSHGHSGRGIAASLVN